MTMMELLALPDDVTVPIRYVRQAIATQSLERQASWVNTARAAEILEKPQRDMRRRALQWERAQERGRTPGVRVRRKSDAPHSDLLFHEADLYELKRKAAPVLTMNVADIVEAAWRDGMGGR